jgi:hypothetical protein
MPRSKWRPLNSSSTIFSLAIADLDSSARQPSRSTVPFAPEPFIPSRVKCSTVKNRRLRATFNGTKWRLKRIGDDFDCRLQGLDPLLAIAGVGILFRMAEQISFYI